MADRSRYDGVAIGLHWTIAAGIGAQLLLGVVMTQVALPLADKFNLYQLHKSIGVTVLLAVLGRVAWRLTHRPPPLPGFMPAGERRAASAAHLVLYVLMLALPLSGWAMVSASVRPFPTVLFQTVPWPHLPILSSLVDKAPVEQALKWAHALLAWSIVVVLVLHVGGAVRHALQRDGVLWRMAPFLGRRA